LFTVPGGRTVGKSVMSGQGTETPLPSSVTAPFRAKALPDMFAPVFKVMLVSARMSPANVVVVPRVADEPTCQNTLRLKAPLIKEIDELVAVVRVVPIWKIKTALESPRASRVSVPVN